MFLCLCHGVKVRTVKECIDSKENCKLFDVVKETGAGSCCGSCLEQIVELIGEDNDEQQQEEDPISETEGYI